MTLKKSRIQNKCCQLFKLFDARRMRNVSPTTCGLPLVTCNSCVPTFFVIIASVVRPCQLFQKVQIYFRFSPKEEDIFDTKSKKTQISMSVEYESFISVCHFQCTIINGTYITNNVPVEFRSIILEFLCIIRNIGNIISVFDFIILLFVLTFICFVN